MKHIGWTFLAPALAALGCGSTSPSSSSPDDGSTQPPPTLKDGCDLAITSVSAATGTAGGGTTVEYTVANLGNACAPDFSTSLAYVHAGVPWTEAEQLGNDFVIDLAMGGTQKHTVTLPVRADAAAGTYQLRVRQDRADDDASNDEATSTIDIASTIHCSDDAYEPDSDETAPHALTLGVAETHNFCFDSVDYAKLDVTTASSYVIHIAFADGATSPGVILKDPSNSSWVTTGNGAQPFDRTFVPSHAGTFVLEMYRSIDLGAPDLDYTVVVTEVPR